MKSTELRIGNLVHYEYKEMSKDMPVTMTLLYEVENYLYSSRVKPILLTEEWLLKMGFENILEVVAYLEDKSIIALSGNSEMLIEHLKDIHVHTFQNLVFALTGEELTIKE